MSERIKDVGLYLRTAFFVSALRSSSGLGAGRLEERIRRNQYEAHGLQPPAVSTVRDYFLLRRSPAVDPQHGNQAPWLFAAEAEFPGASFGFFHPVFDLLLGQVASSRPWQGRLQRIPEAWIAVTEARGDKCLADEWRAFNSTVEPKRGRPRSREAVDPLSFIHLTMLRLPESYRSSLFSREGLATGYARRYSPIEDEVRLLHGRHDMECLAAMIGLVQEAAQIGDKHRLGVAKQAVKDHLSEYGFVRAAKRIEKRLRYLIDSEVCLALQGRRYGVDETMGFGLPATWRVKAYEFVIERRIARLFGGGPESAE